MTTSLRDRRCLGCKTPITRPRICCPACWHRLPYELRLGVTTAGMHTGAGLEAVRAVVDWFRKADSS